MIGITFDFDAAVRAAETDPGLAAYLSANAALLKALTPDQLLAALRAWLGSDDRGVLLAATGAPVDQANALVSNAADMANRQYGAGVQLDTAITLAAQLLIDALRAGLVLTGA